MARLSPIDEHNHPELLPLIDEMRDERGRRLLNLYRALLHSPPVATSWLKFNNADD